MWFLVPILLVCAVLIVDKVRQQKLEQFVREHSLYYRARKALFVSYQRDLCPLGTLTLRDSFDNGQAYASVSCYSYFLCELRHLRGRVEAAIRTKEENERRYDRARQELSEIASLRDRYDAESKFSRRALAEKLRQTVEPFTIAPPPPVTVGVVLTRTNAFGGFEDRKRQVFTEEQILEAFGKWEMAAAGSRDGEEIRDAAITVERAKVSFKLRLSIFSRDDWCCRECGAIGEEKDLKLGYILPIERGGKTTYGNLLTLCDRCFAAREESDEPINS